MPFANSFYRQPLTDSAPLDPESPALSHQLANLAFGLDPDNTNDCRATIMKAKDKWTEEDEALCHQVTYSASIQRNDYAPPVYEVGAEQPRVPVVLDNNAASLQRALQQGVPIPDDAQPAPGTDGQLVIYQPSSDTMWEFWRASRDETGAWHARWGGRIEQVSQSPGYYQDVLDPTSLNYYSQQHSWGETASSLPNLPGLITLDDLRSGEIDHALNFAIWTPQRSQWVFPAQRTDGVCISGHCSQIPEGARFRLPPDFDTSEIKHPVVRMVAEAVQRYGMVLNNKTGAGLDLYAQGYRGEGDNPYGTGGIFKVDPKQQYPIMFMREFPWEKLEMLQRGTTCTSAKAACPKPLGWDLQFKLPIDPPVIDPPPVDPPIDPPVIDPPPVDPPVDPPVADPSHDDPPSHGASAPKIKISGIHRSGRRLRVTGRVSGQVKASVALRYRGLGKARRYRVSRAVKPVDGRFAGSLRLSRKAAGHRGVVVARCSRRGDSRKISAHKRVG